MKKIILTKTDFIEYLVCPNSLWIQKNKPEIYREYKGEKSLFLEKLIREGYEVESYVEKLFPAAKDIRGLDSNEVKKLLSQSTGKFLQATFQTKEGAFARTDMLELSLAGEVSLFEIKSSSFDEKKGVKSYDKKHFKDLAFQKHVLEENGYKVKNLFLVYLNKSFIKDGEIDPEKLLHIGDVTKEVEEVFEKTVLQVGAALEHINKEKINESFCSCLENTRSNHCETFVFFNKSIPQNSIYELNNIRSKKIINLKDMGVEKISDIPTDFDLSQYQVLQKEAVENSTPTIDSVNIEDALGKLTFPLYFFDYETLPFAVPKIDGYGPHAQVPMQYSLHVLEEGGEMKHYEHLAEKLENPKKLIENMREQIGKKGSLIS
jgi:CRISPR/Cas system-associated exonuclease Cas4 (RecB family)